MDLIYKHINNKSIYNEVIPNLWVGNSKASSDSEIMKDIDVVLNCTDSLPFNYEELKNHRLSISSNMDTTDIKNIESYLEMSADLINSYLNDKKNILVHCDNGCQRSCSIILAFLIKYKDLDLYKAARTLINEHKLALFPYPYYNLALINYEYNINKKNSSDINYIHIHINRNKIFIVILIIYCIYQIINKLYFNNKIINDKIINDNIINDN